MNLVIATVVGSAVVLGVVLTLMRHLIGKVEESLTARMEAMEARMDARMEAMENRIVTTLRREMADQIGQLRQELRTEVAQLRAEIAQVREGLQELAERVARLEGALHMEPRVGVSPQAS